MKWVVSNCRGLASKLIGQGYELVSDGSDHHLVLVNLWPFNVNGAQVEKILNMASIMLNKKSVADDKSEIFTEGARIGTPGHDYKRFHTERFHVSCRLDERIIYILRKVINRRIKICLHTDITPDPIQTLTLKQPNQKTNTEHLDVFISLCLP
ncbi:serine hydroxymethyltransferase 3, chloroplastic [Daucus carota subsp. sativus]|uniref:serine hydroxymethyltransferase 3, chloroplastic n=1 Tax=Daucus carota subsp. sativus TaxID=79200 RepID=UPI0007F01389|nr:PREDICTED: serine hydroxymethyltransferase 3, chloroplastic-like [Daucus carota subsp. sativus]XP_017223455.1 PREDICTED: serine hydroxymethyltransferase 3, chloroplastic-like [Daucus carota subsp. sativus]XP_017223456.1 PREDICTED: serine hydroxymethyltransferase 3, chloroplastic-like [Daucus carota subsp. sativus]XP_017223457.1 PREDICTED: serine hydroxymethyltransferase 3, chloroplastic-like [Daucus carota subsp. sativus]XP_017223459.1 PREDICTED: serine hydroxymethyltransferase 3, chloroplas